MNVDVCLRERLDLQVLQGVPAFAILPSQAQIDLANELAQERFPSGAVVVAEGAEADRLYLIVSGEATVVTGGPGGDLLVGQLGPGEIFGEIALLTPGTKRNATVRATTELLTLSLRAASFTKLLQSSPALQAAFEASADLLRTATFLKQASPFSALTPKAVRALAKRLKKNSLPKSALVVRQGEEGDTCYLIRRGEVEVVIDEGGAGERVLATLRAGSLFGEAALLTGSPRNATVRTVAPCELLELCRADLIDALGQSRDVRGRMMELLSLRGRPRRIDGVIASHRSTPERATITILCDPRRHAYFQLSPEGWFIWQRLDGQRTLRDIALDYLSAFRSFAPHAIAETIGRLSAAGFLVDRRLSADVQRTMGRTPRWQRMAMALHRIADCRMMWTNVDAAFSRLYRRGGWLLSTWPAGIMMAAVALTGAVAFARSVPDLSRAVPKISAQPLLLLLLAAALLFAILAHELGHALTTKAFGRRVLGIGLGWHWFVPVAFVDTSDMWLSPRWPRIAVTMAGVAANIVLGGLSSLVGLLVSHPSVQLWCWSFTLGSYLLVLVNLNPFIDSDGYHALADLFDRPNLRSDVWSWLKRE